MKRLTSERKLFRRGLRGLFSLTFCLLNAAFVGGVNVESAQAQFLQTDLNTFQLPDPSTSTVIVTTPRGIFVAQMPERSASLAAFDLSQLTLSNSTSLFLEYGTKSFVPQKLILPGKQNEFRIRGSFTLLLSPSIRVAVSMNNSSVPYVSIAFTGRPKQAVIGFLGGQMVVNAAGKEAVELLEADPARRQYGSVVSPYVISPEQKLLISGQPLAAGAAVGLLSLAENDCLLEGARYLKQSDADALLPLDPDRTAAALKKALSASRNLSLDTALILTVSPEKIVAIDSQDSSLQVIRRREILAQPLCIIETQQLNKMKATP
jgi:hypothetical protein